MATRAPAKVVSPLTEPDLAEVLLDLVDTSATDYDPAELLYDLTRASVRLLGVEAAGVLLLDEKGHLIPAASTGDSTHQLERLQVQARQGPCLDSVRTGSAVSCVDLAHDSERWAEFTHDARAQGFAAVHAVPLRRHGDVIGGLNLFCVTTGYLTASDQRDAQHLAMAATIGILHRRSLHVLETVNGQLEYALASRIVIEQAKGALSERHTVSLDDAFVAMRAYARRRRLPLLRVARSVIDQHLDL